MRTRNAIWNAWLAASMMMGLALGGCGPASKSAAQPGAPSATAAPSQPAQPSATADPLPSLTLTAGENYFRLNGQQAFIYSRNLAGYSPDDFDTLVQAASRGGDVLVRVALDSQAMGGNKGYGYTSDGAIVDRWSDRWEHFFRAAEANGVYVLPFFTGWANWNETGYNTWADNPFNAANGGPAHSPTEIFKQDSPTQKLYIQWFKNVVQRWQAHRNILAWELITEVNLISYISEPQGLYLSEKLAQAVHEVDGLDRPTTVSLADMGDWPSLYNSDAVDFINFHPYPPSGQVDRRVLQEVPRFLSTYRKPVLIGESSLSAALPTSEEGRLVVAKNAQIGLAHALWSELMSGAMNGRAFWWEDGYGVYFKELGLPWVNEFQDVEAPAVKFTQGLDMGDMRPVAARTSPRVFGAALGNEGMLIGWFRDASCEPPAWDMQPVISGETVTLNVPGAATRWQVDFYDAKTGEPNGASTLLFAENGVLTVPLSDFSDGVAFKAFAE